MLKPSFTTGYARNKWEADPTFASLWDGLAGAFVPVLGCTGGFISDVTGRDVAARQSLVTWVNGQPGLVLDFAGSGATSDHQTSIDLAGTDNITLAIWYKADVTNTAQHMVYQGPSSVVSDGNGFGGSGSTREPEIHLSLAGRSGTSTIAGQLSAYCGDRGPSAYPNETLFCQTAFTDTTSWHVAVAVFKNMASSPELELWLDGRLVASDTTVTVVHGTWTGKFRIGRPVAAQRYFNGQMGATYAYKRALSSREIITLSQNPICLLQPRQRSYYDLLAEEISSYIKTINGLAKANAKTVNSLAIASVKTWDGLA